MIITKDLRLGNFISYGNDEYAQIVEVDRIYDFGLESSNAIDKFNGDSENFFPIDLTEQHLISCGGEIKPFSLGITLDRFRFIWKDAYKYWYVCSNDPGGQYFTKIEWVHELQNFYHALNGTELNIKL